MTDVTFTHWRNHAKDYFDAVETGATFRIFRHRKAIAQIVPAGAGTSSRRNPAMPLTVNGVSLSK